MLKFLLKIYVNENYQKKLFIFSAFHVILVTKPYVPELVVKPMLEDLQETLEKTENHLLVPTLVNCLTLISEQQPRLFEPRFQVTTRDYYEGVVNLFASFSSYMLKYLRCFFAF